MTLTLLIDLDDTLLGNDLGTFLPAYLDALSGHLEAYVEPNKMVRTMLAATQMMLENTNPACTLKQVFDASFYPILGLDEASVRDPIDTFYAQVFPTLRPLTQHRREAVELVEEALARGYQIGIATNPLFPLTAIRQRLEWAGLPPDQYPFTLIPSYERFHFAKPNPSFFAEFLGWSGWPQGPVVMIGNDRDHDVRAALQLGLAAFWISDNGADQGWDSAFAPAAWGSLEEVLPWLDSISFDSLQPQIESNQALIAVLRSTPAALSGLTADVPTFAWNHRPQPDEWSLSEIACHFRDVEMEVNLPRMHKLLEENNPFLKGKDTDPWAEERDYLHQDGRVANREFTSARMETLRLLENIDELQWRSPARHAIFGPTDLKELVSIIASHDRLHLRQVRNVISELLIEAEDD